MTHSVFPVSLMVAFTSVLFIPGEADIPWFGDEQQYKCHCQNNECTPTGQCTPGYSCERGWFGPECQYVDLAAKYTHSNTSDAYILTDGRDDSCVTSDTSSVTITLDKAYPFTWMRVYTTSTGNCFDVSIYFSPLKPTGCIKINDPLGFFDVYCYSHGSVSKITLSGRCTSSLCSVYVSGGRNVALKQITRQSGIYNESGIFFGPERSVDGNTNTDLVGGISCSQTQMKINSWHFWTVFFNYPTKIYRYAIYDRFDSEEKNQRINGFLLLTRDKANQVIFEHVDNHAVAQSVHEIIDDTNSQPAAATTIKKFNVTTLNLCEVEIYGDTECDDGFYGRECQQRCDSNCVSKYCFPSTGACPSMCKPGYIGISCKEKLEMFKPISIA